MHKQPEQADPAKSNPGARPTVSVVGARGYSGIELVKLLLRHPGVQLTHCFATQSFSLDDEIPGGTPGVLCLADNRLLETPTDIVFLATPAETSMELAPRLLAQGRRVVDLSGAFRLKKSDMKEWYGFEQKESQLLAAADYGLMPFAGPLSPQTKLIANPGCYATAVSMALIPLLKHGVIESQGLVIDAKSGTTGAGRKAGENLLFSEVDGECLPYRVGKHQHLPEIRETVAKFSGVDIDPHFVTHLLPVKRGIVASIFAKTKADDLGLVRAAFEAEYHAYPLVRHGAKIAQLAKLQNVVATPFVHISYELTGNKLYIFAALDNLLKGAASQAVENLNRLLDLPLTSGLTSGMAGEG